MDSYQKYRIRSFIASTRFGTSAPLLVFTQIVLAQIRPGDTVNTLASVQIEKKKIHEYEYVFRSREWGINYAKCW